MRALKAFLDFHGSAGLLLSLGPALVLLMWFWVGQWDSARPEPRAWLQFAGVLCVASLLPLPGHAFSLAFFRSQIAWWGWIIVLGLIVMS